MKYGLNILLFLKDDSYKLISIMIDYENLWKVIKMLKYMDKFIQIIRFYGLKFEKWFLKYFWKMKYRLTFLTN